MFFHISPIFFPYLAICSSYFFHLFFGNSNVFFSILPYPSIFFVGKSYVFPDLSQIFPIFFRIFFIFPDISDFFFSFFHMFFHISIYFHTDQPASRLAVPGQPARSLSWRFPSIRSAPSPHGIRRTPTAPPWDVILPL